MISHLFNESDFSKQDFILDFKSSDFSQMYEIYGEDVFLYKIQVKLEKPIFDKIVSMIEFVKNKILDKKSQNEVVCFIDYTDSKTQIVELFCPLSVILAENENIKLESTIQVI
jgi:hypothetical protein